MLLDQETLRFIFGLKLRNFRQQKGLSLQAMAKTTHLSPSYLNEIEKGKKYPKSDKIALLATSLDVSYDDLVSVKLNKELSLLSELFEKNVLTGLPLHIFGIPAQTILELAAERPQEAAALFGMILEIVRNYHLSIEEFFYAILRAHLDLNDNYFPEIEEAARQCKKEFRLATSGEIECSQLREILEDGFDYRVAESDFSKFRPDIQKLPSLFENAEQPFLFINRGIDDRERRFLLLRELGFCYLKLKERAPASATSFDSFEQLFNNFRASYFSSAILIPEDLLVKDVTQFFRKRTWDPSAFLGLVLKYPGTVESFFHRLSQILPRNFGMDELFYLRFSHNTKTGELDLSRELHLSSLHGPHRAKDTEHYCQRWLTLVLLQKVAKQKAEFQVGSQRSAFFGTENEYLCFTVAKKSPIAPQTVAFTLGLHLNDKVRETVSFLGDSKIALRHVADTCERCGVKDCEERAAPPSLFEAEKRGEKLSEEISEAITRLREQAKDA